MSPEVIAALVAGALLALSAVVQLIALFFRDPGARWANWSILGLRVAAAAALGMAAVMMALSPSGSGWSASDLRQTAIALSLSALVVSLAMQLWLRTQALAAGPVVDLVALGVALFAALAIRPGAVPSARPATVQQLQWIMWLLGAGSLVAAGSTGLMLAVYGALGARAQGPAWPQRADLYRPLFAASALGVVLLGAGLGLSVWWAWRTQGSLTSGDPRETWAAAAALLALGSLWTWRLGRQSGRWAAILAICAAILVVTGVLAAVDLHEILVL